MASLGGGDVEARVRSLSTSSYDSTEMFPKLLFKTYCFASRPSKSIQALPSWSKLATLPNEPLGTSFAFLLFVVNVTVALTSGPP
jgi:hypothetical protein